VELSLRTVVTKRRRVVVIWEPHFWTDLPCTFATAQQATCACVGFAKSRKRVVLWRSTLPIPALRLGIHAAYASGRDEVPTHYRTFAWSRWRISRAIRPPRDTQRPANRRWQFRASKKSRKLPTRSRWSCWRTGHCRFFAQHHDNIIPFLSHAPWYIVIFTSPPCATMWSHIPTLLIFEHLRISGTYTLWLFSVREEWQPRTGRHCPMRWAGQCVPGVLCRSMRQ